ncbi:MAG: hypothetical protein J5859_03370 [Clostridia bacterium]|nr:hypothetical protein [Clostridia bacterium]
MDEMIKQYIERHSFCSEYLFKDWNSFLDLLYSGGGRVSAILWWDHCRKKMQHMSAGSGGYTDPDDPEYMYAETQFYEEGFETKSLDEVKDHINARRKTGLILGDKYLCFDLVPSFYLAE